MTNAITSETLVTTRFRTLGYVGALLFTFCPPVFLYELYQLFYTTAVEGNPLIGLFTAGSLVLSFASVPLMIIGRRQQYRLVSTPAHPTAGH
ncbi:hypothetical protein FPY71_15305 [Aureimonas fodinaquatilis]|uniref:Uncharacterized protein n=1 Tax=Aureimonas fodinaquatilis TaxID=2565783 RepID=A0A5B0DTP1_9HYPH|nr:hypothetical protein [Aureimonas fodinaquatilis]KAA0968930.1 hypothetical protein FPY71_15305 [Aureimonas fodinaquatilis]